MCVAGAASGRHPCASQREVGQATPSHDTPRGPSSRVSGTTTLGIMAKFALNQNLPGECARGDPTVDPDPRCVMRGPSPAMPSLVSVARQTFPKGLWGPRSCMTPGFCPHVQPIPTSSFPPLAGDTLAPCSLPLRILPSGSFLTPPFPMTSAANVMGPLQYPIGLLLLSAVSTICKNRISAFWTKGQSSVWVQVC